ncbi:hypothetical protein HDU76_005238 [Blyttiomyces sp. JEL0837]|nr:hypothetical protein HDU76_005238 [Blyttiomyces sp. JEL0837]
MLRNVVSRTLKSHGAKAIRPHTLPAARAFNSITRRRPDGAVGANTGSRGLFDPFALMERRMNEMFGDLAAPIFSNGESRPGWSVFSDGPKVDFSETDNAYVMKADLPGLAKDEVNITIKDNVLTVSGERKTSIEDKNEQRHVVERSYGHFSRQLLLPKDANPDEINASMDQGVLKLTIAKRPAPPEEGIKKIDIA